MVFSQNGHVKSLKSHIQLIITFWPPKITLATAQLSYPFQMVHLKQCSDQIIGSLCYMQSSEKSTQDVQLCFKFDVNSTIKPPIPPQSSQLVLSDFIILLYL